MNIPSKLVVRSNRDLEVAVAKELEKNKGPKKSISELIDEQSKDKDGEDNSHKAD